MHQKESRCHKNIENEYYKTPEFAELKARRVYGKAAPGESVYTLSDDVAKATLKTPYAQMTNKVDSTNSKPKYQQNFEAWIDFFFRK